MALFFDFSQLEPLLQLLLAGLLGALVGLEREHRKKEAGLRTFALVALGTCFFTLTAVCFSYAYNYAVPLIQIDPGRVIQAVAIGIGFLGSGIIIQRKDQIEGLTTAAALWATAALGIGVGLKLYTLSASGALLIVIVMVGLKAVERRVFKKK